MFESTRAEPACPYPPDLRRRDEVGLLQDADVLPHAREGHLEGLGQIRDRSVATPESLQHAASGGIRDRCEGGIESLARILNHTVQYKPSNRRSQGAARMWGWQVVGERIRPDRTYLITPKYASF